MASNYKIGTSFITLTSLDTLGVIADPRSSFQLFADQRFASRTVTGAFVPDDLDWKAFNGELKRRGLVLAGGQGKLTGKIFRLGHLGSVTLEEILGAMSVLEFVSIAFGRDVRPGAAVAAAQVAALESFGVVAPSVAGAGAGT